MKSVFIRLLADNMCPAVCGVNVAMTSGRTGDFQMQPRGSFSWRTN